MGIGSREVATIYIVTSGSYSGYRIDGIFDDRILAERFKELWKCERIEERELNPHAKGLRAGLQPIMIHMRRDGTSTVDAIYDSSSVYADELTLTFPEYFYPRLPDGSAPGILHGCVFAEDESGAAKIANEKRVALIASGEWPEENKPQ